MSAPMPEPCLLYITAGDREEALAIGRALVGERLAACANILGGIVSVYRWEGAVAEDEEVALVAKTTRDRVDAAVARVRALHSYDCPCIISLPVTGGNPAFLAWLREETLPA